MTRQGQTFTYGYLLARNQLENVSYTGSSNRESFHANNFVYDADGRMVVDESKHLDLAYDDHLGRPSRFSSVDGSSVHDFYMVYDGGGNRVSKIEFSNAVFQEAKHYFLHGKEVREDASHAVTEVYAFAGFGRVVKIGSNWEYEGNL